MIVNSELHHLKGKIYVELGIEFENTTPNNMQYKNIQISVSIFDNFNIEINVEKQTLIINRYIYANEIIKILKHFLKTDIRKRKLKKLL